MFPEGRKRKDYEKDDLIQELYRQNGQLKVEQIRSSVLS
jgi:hypothetical protein